MPAKGQSLSMVVMNDVFGGGKLWQRRWSFVGQAVKERPRRFRRKRQRHPVSRESAMIVDGHRGVQHGAENGEHRAVAALLTEYP